MVTRAPSDPESVQGQLWAGIRSHVGWDIGANTGESTARMVEVFGHVYAFEPCAESFGDLQGAFGSHPKVRLFNFAVAEYDGVLTMTARANPIRTGQLTPDTTGREPADGDWGDWGPPVEFREIPCRSIDNLLLTGIAPGGPPASDAPLARPDVVKVDVEGHDVQVLQGAQMLLTTRAVTWLIEFHGPDLYKGCMDLLTGAGYAPETIRHPAYSPGSDFWHMHGWIRAEAPKE